MKYHISSGVLRSYIKEYYKLIVLALAGLFIFTQFFALLDFSSATEVEDYSVDGKVWICHANDAVKNRYVAIEVSINGLNGHDEHDGPFAETEEEAQAYKDQKPKVQWGDVIPPFGDFKGLNWEDGQSYWFENCDGRDGGEVIGDSCTVGSWALEVLDFNQGTLNNGGVVLAARSNPDSMTGATNGVFFSFGKSGWATIDMGGYVEDVGGNDIVINEVTNEPYPEEKAKVEISQDGNTWVQAGYATNNGGVGGASGIDVNGTGLIWFRYVKVTDETDFTKHNATADGFDIDSISANIVCEEPEPEVSSATINAKKIICDEESDLPNWGIGGENITADTAQDWLDDKGYELGCDFAESWDYQYRLSGDATYDGSYGELNGWTKFTNDTKVELDGNITIQLREVLSENYIPFAGWTTEQGQGSAEFYCNDDVLNYDNWEWIQNPQDGATYYCVAWNVPVPPEVLACSVEVLSDATNLVADYGNAYAKVLSWTHPAWTANVPGASWIWSDDPVLDPTNETIRTFTKTFEWDGTLNNANIYIGADNDYVIWVNGSLVANGTNTYGAAASHDITSYLQNGINTIKIEVTNWEWPTVSATVNPAGLMYKVVAEGTSETGECGGTTEQEGRIEGLIYEDVNGNGSQQPKELPMQDWDAMLFTHNSPFTLVGKDVTDVDGLFVFEHLEFGSEFYVCQNLQEGWEQTELPAGIESIGDLSLNYVVADGSALHDLIVSNCYGPIVLDEEHPISDFSVFGNHIPREDDDDEGGQTGVLGDSDDKTGGQGGAVLADTDTLSDTGTPTLLFISIGLVIIATTATLATVSVKKSRK